MAGFVILIMVSFMGLGQMLRYVGQKADKEVVAYYATKTKITNFDLNEARQELELLQALQAEAFLQSSDMRGLFLSEILFSERSIDPRVLSYLNQTIQKNGLRITPEQITNLYQGNSNAGPNVFWFLLNQEAAEAGMAVETETVKMLLKQVGSELFNGMTYKQLMQQTMQRFKMSESDILGTYSNLLSIMQFARMATESHDTTTSQVKHMASWTKETLSTELVKLDAKEFLKLEDPNAMPSESALSTHFDKFKGVEPGTVSEENPHGLGYRLPDRIQLEYMVVKLDDVLKTIDSPSAKDLEEYYQKIASSVFTEQVSADPNLADDDPNAVKKDVILSYAEVASKVEKRLIVEKTIQKTNDILQKAKTLVQIPYSQDEVKAADQKKLTQEVQGKFAFSKASETLKSSFPSVTVYTGTTGLLSQNDMSGDSSLRRLVMSGAGGAVAQLADVMFTTEPLDSSDPRLMSMTKPWLFNTIGPVKDQYTSPGTSVAGQIMALVRIVAVEPSTEPAGLAAVYNKNGLMLDTAQVPKQVALKNLVVEDVKTLQAYQKLEARTKEFMNLVADGSWDTAVKQLNRLYGKQISTNPSDPNVFSLEPQQLRRTPDSQISQMEAMVKMNPMILGYVNSIRADNTLFETLYKKIPADQDKADNLPLTVTSPANYSVYCIKDLSLARLSEQEYEKNKAEIIIRETQIAAQSLAIVHFTPDNILSRMAFKWKKTKTDADTEDANDSAN